MIEKDFERVFLVCLYSQFIRVEFIYSFWMQTKTLLPQARKGMLGIKPGTAATQRRDLWLTFRQHSNLARTSSNLAKYRNISKKSSLWGPLFWRFFHEMASRSPNVFNANQQNTARSFISSIPFMLPCRPCRLNSYAEIKERNIIRIRKREDFVRFFDRLHCAITARLRMQAADEKSQTGCKKQVKITF